MSFFNSQPTMDIIDIQLESERILLRPWSDADAEDLYKYASNPAIGNAAGWPPHTSLEMSREVIRSVFSAPDTYAVILKYTKEAVGCIGIVPEIASHYPRMKDRERELGYWIAEEYWGLGLIPEAITLVERQCRNILQLEGLWIVTYAENRKSRRVAEKSGFRLVETFNDYEERPSTAFYKRL